MSVRDNTQSEWSQGEWPIAQPREQVLLKNNDRLEIGPVVFSVRLTQE